MRLLKADIHNYRSLKDVTVSFDPPCRVLVGINESGKSNILNALAFLSDDYVPDRKEDVRDSLPDEAEVTEAFIRFYFRLDKAEADEVFESVAEKVFASAHDPEIAQIDGDPVGLKSLCNRRTEVRYFVNLITAAKQFRYVNEPGMRLNGKWGKPTKTCPPSFSISRGDESTPLSAYRLIRLSDVTDIPPDYLTEATIQDLVDTIGSAAADVATTHVPNALFWDYDEENLLPSQVPVSAFASNPDTCAPLKNMFLLGGITDIGAELHRIAQLSANKKQNFLDRIASKTTSHFRSVWKEYRNVEFQLRFEGDKIIPGIKEKNSFDFAKRSDGFKRFVTFLLMISVTVKLETLTDTLLLVDEPDVGLHPSGARYLRDELIRISSKNYVIYSTHSIFMIDSGNVERHYIVTKKSEITTVDAAKESNIKDEEVLFNALGFSMFEVLSPKNLIFEGWRDKKLFETALPMASATTRRKVKEAGLCHAKGVANIKTITPMIELARRECVIVSDSDEAAKNQQKQYRQAKGFGEWKTYQDIDPALRAVTGEDFIKNSRIVAHVNEAITGFGLPTFAAADLPEERGKLRAIEAWLTSNGLTAAQVKDTVDRVKELSFGTLTASDIESSYAQLMKGISALI